MRLVDSETMRAIDAHAIGEMGIAGLRLMESAGLGTVLFIEDAIGIEPGQIVTVVCGKGNNGGDGFVIARELRARGVDARVYLVGHAADVVGDARTNVGRFGAGNIVELPDGRGVPELVDVMGQSAIVVDAVFGTGFSGVPRGLSGTIIGQMNLSGRPVLAVDVPSGLDATTGKAGGECVRATWTCTMGLPKRGFYLHPGRELVGEVHVVDIGIPAEAIRAVGVRENVLTPDEIAAALPKRPPGGHKGTFGRVVVIAGSVGYTGAAALASTAALRSGAGLVTLGVPESLNDVMETKLTEVITVPLRETQARSLSPDALPAIRELLTPADAVALGPGVSRNAETQVLVRSLLEELDVPCVVDADGLNALSIDVVAGRRGKAPLVLTPHPGEMARLVGLPTDRIAAAREDVARDAATRSGATVLLKGAGSVTASPDGEVYLNPTGNDGLGTAGSGDVLTGVIAALLARGVPGDRAAALGAYLHGLAGDFAAEARGRVGMIAGDVLDEVPSAFACFEPNG